MVKHSSLTHVSTKNPAENTNQNFVDDCSVKYRKKRRKISTKILGITSAKDDFTQYLSEKKLHDVGRMNLKKYMHTSFEINQLVNIF